MKKIFVLALLGLLAGSAWAAQDVGVSQREVRDPRKFEAIFEANAADVESRLAVIEAIDGAGGALTPGYIVVGQSDTVAVAVAVSGDIAMTTGGVVSISSGVIVNDDVATNAAIVSTKLSAEAQASLALADSALQPNAASYTNVIVSADAKTNTITVIDGQLTDWTVTE